MKRSKGKVFVGLSGGVDSSVSAALLKKAGYDVTGVFIKVWQPDFLPCTWKEDRMDAMRVAAVLDIPFTTMDLEKEYKQGVVDYMIDEYKKGRTPNPDVMCNRRVKFGAFFDKAMEMGADFVATGHYARVQKKDDMYVMRKGVDDNKDQTYFLWTLSQRELSKTFFPIGEYEKPKVRELAKAFHLPTATKKDSQGLCFIGRLDMKDFLKEFIEEKPGNVLDKNGEVIGTHDGAYFYTIGQRHGFTITKKSTHDAPYYIIGKNIEGNTITVSNEEGMIDHGGKNETNLSGCNWTTGVTPSAGEEFEARTRYRGPLLKCAVTRVDGASATVMFKEPTLVSSGQSLVFYRGDECAGGGVIE